MVATTLVELFDNEGNVIDSSFFSAFSTPSAKKFANNRNALVVRAYDVENENETLYVKAGADGRWTETTRKVFDFVIERNKGGKKT